MVRWLEITLPQKCGSLDFSLCCINALLQDRERNLGGSRLRTRQFFSKSMMWNSILNSISSSFFKRKGRYDGRAKHGWITSKYNFLCVSDTVLLIVLGIRDDYMKTLFVHLIVVWCFAVQCHIVILDHVVQRLPNIRYMGNHRKQFLLHKILIEELIFSWIQKLSSHSFKS